MFSSRFPKLSLLDDLLLCKMLGFGEFIIKDVSFCQWNFAVQGNPKLQSQRIANPISLSVASVAGSVMVWSSHAGMYGGAVEDWTGLGQNYAFDIVLLGLGMCCLHVFCKESLYFPGLWGEWTWTSTLLVALMRLVSGVTGWRPENRTTTWNVDAKRTSIWEPSLVAKGFSQICFACSFFKL